MSLVATATLNRGAPDYPASQLWPIKGLIYLSLLSLFIGGLFGLFQALERAEIDLYPQLPLVKNYYQGLTLHGVFLALFFTFAFTNGFLTLTTMRGFGRSIASTSILQATFWVTLAGAALASWAMFANKATVLFTFYPPLKATPIFYVGLVLAVVGTWLAFLNQILTARAWRKEHPGERMPLMAFASLMTYLMWTIASVGIAVEVLWLILPWSLGWLETTDPQLSRTLFWLTGHPIVYFWLLPAYISWYTMIPAQVGGRLFSDPLARVVFILLLLLSIPVGFHHQFTESGVHEGFKIFHGILTFGVAFPSLITAFSIMAALESGGRAWGGKGLLGWIPRLPWGNPSVTAQLLAMLVFTLGGATGLINASQTVNLVVHNTAFIVGHFHMTVGTAVALSFIGIGYWLLPYLTGKAIWLPKMAVLQAWLWAIGVLVFARGQISGGLLWMPRRTAMAGASYLDLMPEWTLPNLLTAIGGVIMAVSGLLLLLVLIGSLLGWGGRAKEEIPVAETAGDPLPKPWPILDKWHIWVGATVALVIVAYLPYLATYMPPNLTSPGFTIW